MKLSDFATELVAGNNFVKAAFGGMAGAGKSRTASEFVIGAYKDLGYSKPVLVIDNEKGSRFLIPQFRRAGIQAMLKDTTNLDDVSTAFDLLADGQIEFLFIDSLTKVYYRYTRDYLTKNRKQFMELNDWGKLLPKWQEAFSDRFVAAQGSIVFTGRGGFSYDKEEDEKDETGRVIKKGSFVKSGVKIKLAGETPFEPDLNVWMEQHQDLNGDPPVWREAQIMKDRSGLIDGKHFTNPTYEQAFQPFVRFLLEVPKGPVAGESSTLNVSPGENYESQARRTQKDIALEEIEAEMVKLYPGQAVADKTAKANLLEELFKTRSWKAVQLLSLEVLREARNRLWVKSRGHAYGEQPPEIPLIADTPINDDLSQIPQEGPLQPEVAVAGG